LPIWTGTNISSPPEIDPRTIQPVAITYTYYAHPTPVSNWSLYSFKPEDLNDIKKKRKEKVLLDEDTLRPSHWNKPVDAFKEITVNFELYTKHIYMLSVCSTDVTLEIDELAAAK
jgi:hypothetical protein